MSKNKKLNVIRGGVAKQIPGMPNYYFMEGLPHELGGIDIGKDLEVENNEVVHVGKDNIKVYSSVPFLNGVSPAEKVLGGDNPTTVFREQEQFKSINGLKDDGTKKELGGEDDPKNKKKLPFFSLNPKDMIYYYTARGFGKTKNGDWGFISKNGHAYDTEEDKKKYDEEYDNLVKIGYIGGSPIEARRKYFKSDKRMTQFVDSVANSHGLPSNVLKNSLANEGFVDHNIKRINSAYSKRRKGGTEGEFNDFGLLGEEVLTDWYDNYNNFGSDDSGTYYKERPDVKRIIDRSGIKPEFYLNSNEKGRTVSTLQGKNNKENIIIQSAILTSFRNEIKKQHPNWTNDQINNYTLYRFNYGPYANGNINDVMKRDKFNARNYKRLGGSLYSLTVDGQTKLHQFPSTGESFARSAKGKVIAKLGTEKRDKQALANTHNRLKKGITPITTTINTTLDDTTPVLIPTDKAHKRRVAVQRIKNKVNNLITPDNAALVSNVIGSVISHGINKSMLDDLEYSPRPVTRRANKLKTKININPQIDAMRESLAEYRQHINDNTASSRTARALMNRGLTRYVSGVNTVYANKENQETDLINKDRLNQQEVTNANIADYNNWRTNKVNFDNSVIEKKSENDIGLISNINAGIQDIISRGEKRFNERQNRSALIAANPNVNPLILRDLGIKGITDKDVRNYYKVYGNKNKKG